MSHAFDVNCTDCSINLMKVNEFAYMVRDAIWQASLSKARRAGRKVSTFDHLCVACLEQRLGRELGSLDFERVPLTYSRDYRRSKRLIGRMGGWETVKRWARVAKLAQGRRLAEAVRIARKAP